MKSSAKLDLIIGVNALVSTRHVIELPTVRLVALILEHTIVSVEEFRRLWPGLHIASTTNILSWIQRRAAEVRSRVFTSSSALSTSAADEVPFHWVIGNGSKNIWILPDLFGIEDSGTNAHAIGAVWFLESQLRRADVLIEGATRRSAVEFPKVRVVHSYKSASNWSEFHV